MLGVATTHYIQTKHYRKRLLAGMIALLCQFYPKAQTYFPGQLYRSSPILWAPAPSFGQAVDGRFSNQHWFFSKYAAISAGTTFSPSGYSTFLSAPIGLQLNRQLNNNLYAFMGVYAAPTIVSYNHVANQPFTKAYMPYSPNPYSLSINPGIQMGLMHVNDAGTFSISGSIRVERSSYPLYPPAPNYQKKH
jgi:hypothetical protein